MELKSLNKLNELKKKHGYEIAELKQNSNILRTLNDQELLDSLIVFELQNKLIEIIIDLHPYISKDVMPSLISSVFGDIMKKLISLSYEDKEVIIRKLDSIKYFEKNLTGSVHE